MAKENTEDFLFSLIKLTTEQFAVFEDNYDAKGELEMFLQSKFMADSKNRILGVLLQFKLRMEESQKEVLIIESGLHFQIERSTWENCLDKDRKILTIPVEHAAHFTTLAVGATRGMLHSKTEGTCVNHLLLPLLSVDQFIDDKDLIINLKNLKPKNKKASN